jgi:hypothetical protein
MAKFKLARRGVTDAVAQGIRQGLTLEAACALAGVHRTTLHRWLRASPESEDGERLQALQEAVAEAQAANLAELVGVAHRMALDGDGGMVRFLLERRHGWRAEAVGAAERGRAEVVPAQAEPVRYRITIPVVERIGEPPTRYSVSDGEDGWRMLTPAEAVAEGVVDATDAT